MYVSRTSVCLQVSPNSIVLVSPGSLPDVNTTAMVLAAYTKTYPKGTTTGGAAVLGYWLVTAPGKVIAPPEISGISAPSVGDLML